MTMVLRFGSRSVALLLVLGLGACGGSGGPSSDASLLSLALSHGTLVPAFGADVTAYTVGPALVPQTVQVTPTARDTGATIRVNGVAQASGAASGPLALAPGVTTVTIAVTAPDATTVRTTTIAFTRALGGQEAYAKASNPDPADGLSGSYEGFQETTLVVDGDTLVVSAIREASNATGVGGNQADNSAALAGAVYVFTRSGATWAQQAYLKASNAEAGDHFGLCLALSGDTLVVGAPLEDGNATGVNGPQGNNLAIDAGAAYVFVRSGTTWTQQAYLKASNTGAGDQFGISVALDGDTLAVGAYQEASSATGVGGNQADNTAPQSGAAYVFVRSGATWTQQAYLKASNTELGDIFGVSLSLSGDTLAVGASNEASNATGVGGNQADNSEPSSGAVYVFVRSGAAWAQQAYVKASNSEALDGFGISLALWGDTLAVCAYQEDSSATGVNGNQTNNAALDSGAVYVLTRQSATWSQQAYLKASNTGASDQFGVSVGLSGDALVVGANHEDSIATGLGGNQADNSAPDSGAAYLFLRSAGVWTQQAYLKASNAEAGDWFGLSVALEGETLAVGAFAESSSATGVGGNQLDNSTAFSGAVYVFR